ncbi:MAG TPA: SgcJ/EcaC family oxidoreductase [Sphingomicrobium sp.]|nr:SgcJ/EcaC family oxidoreductase [Sphingomicrobium sp.]
MIRPTVACLAVAALTACGPAPQDDDASSAEAAIRTATESWLSAYGRGDANALANLYEQDAIYAANTGEVLRGRDGIREGIRGWIAQRPAGVQLKLEEQPVRFAFLGNGAHTVSRFVIRAMPAGCSIQAGHALAVWRPQRDGSWLITSQLVNRDPEPPADACPRPAAIVPDDEGLNTLRSHPGYADQPVVFLNFLDFESTEAQARYFKDYAAPALELVAEHGGGLLWAGSIDQHFVGYAGGGWDYAAFVRWPSRAAFVSMIESEEYRALHRVRQETLRSTAIMAASEASSPQK